MIIVNMTKEHIPQIAKLEKECFSSPWSEKSLSEELDNSASHFICALDGDELMGYIGVQEICGEAYITNIAVFSEYRGRGVGRALLKNACGGAEKRDCEFITLEVRKSNEAAISLYISEGFKEAGIRKNFYSDPTEDGIIYTKNFVTR